MAVDLDLGIPTCRFEGTGTIDLVHVEHRV